MEFVCGLEDKALLAFHDAKPLYKVLGFPMGWLGDFSWTVFNIGRGKLGVVVINPGGRAVWDTEEQRYTFMVHQGEGNYFQDSATKEVVERHLVPRGERNDLLKISIPPRSRCKFEAGPNGLILLSNLTRSQEGKFGFGKVVFGS